MSEKSTDIDETAVDEPSVSSDELAAETPVEEEEVDLEKINEVIHEAADALVRDLAALSSGDASEGFDHLLELTANLVSRKHRMEGTKHETRDVLAELLFSRLRKGMRKHMHPQDSGDEIRAAEWVLGAMFSISTLTGFATAIDRAILESGSSRDFSFGGMCDFISIEEVLQMLASGKHLGCVSLEKEDNRLDIYIQNGRVAYLDPHHMIRRVLPGQDSMQHREISEDHLREAESRRAADGQPVFTSLAELGVFRESELRDVMRVLGQEVLFDFLRDQSSCRFFYKRLEELPEFATTYNLRLGATPILLECSKRVDDWQSMIPVFPDPTAPIQPTPDMYARMGGMDLGMLEIKLLAQINGEQSPVSLVSVMGLPLFDVYQLLVKLARDGVLEPPGGIASLDDVTMSLEESMEMAFEALDANEDLQGGRGSGLTSALDRVLGDDEVSGLAPQAEQPSNGGGLGFLDDVDALEAPRSGSRSAAELPPEFAREPVDDPAITQQTPAERTARRRAGGKSSLGSEFLKAARDKMN